MAARRRRQSIQTGKGIELSVQDQYACYGLNSKTPCNQVITFLTYSLTMLALGALEAQFRSVGPLIHTIPLGITDPRNK